MTLHRILPLIAFALASSPVLAQRPVAVANPMEGIDLEQKLNAQVPLDTPFKDETGRDVRLKDYFREKPIILNLIFYKCPGICITEMDGMIKSFNKLKLQIGDQFEVVTISIDPREGPNLAAFKKQEYAKLYKRTGVEKGWHFLTGKDPDIRKVADSIGYRYVFDKKRGLYNHPAGLIVLTPQGVTSRYLYGTSYTSTNVTFALMDASKGRIGSLVEKVVRSCYDYDPASGKYGLVITRVLQLAGVTTALCMAGFLVIMFRWERKRGYRDVPPPSNTPEAV